MQLSNRRAVLSVTVILACLAAGVAYAQSEEPIRITDVLTDEFPNVKVQVAAWEASNSVTVVIPNENLRVIEDGVPYEILGVEPVDIGVRVAFVIDPGDGRTSTGVPFEEVYTAAAQHLDEFLIGGLWMKNGIDEVAVVVQEGETTELLSPMSSDPALISQQLAAYELPTDTEIGRPGEAGEFTRTALRRGLDELQFAPGNFDLPKALVIFTPGMRADTSDIAERAIEAEIPIYVVMTRDQANDFWEVPIEPLAQVTGGEYETEYGTGGDLTEMFETITRRRQQLHVRYRSESATDAERSVVVELDGTTGTLTAQGDFSVSVESPAVEVINPAPGSVINRQQTEGGDDPAEAQPTFVTVVAGADFPDGYPRGLGSAQLLVDGTPAGQGEFVDGRAEMTWDIRGYQEPGQVPATLQVVVTDELGLQGQSNPTTVSVNYIEPPPPDTLGRILLFVTLGLSLAAIAAAGYLFLNRDKLMPALAGAGESLSDFVERVTGRRTALVAKAYLVPVEGFDEPPQRSFEVYGTTAIGRSRKHADLLFHINDEDSPISRLHCTLLDEDDHFAVRDEDSTNGTLVNGEMITPLDPVPVHDGDTIDIAPIERGGLRLLFQVADVTGELPDVSGSRDTKPRRLSDFENQEESWEDVEEFLATVENGNGEDGDDGEDEPDDDNES